MAITAPDWNAIGKGVPRYDLRSIDKAGFQLSINTPGSVAYQAVQAFGSVDAYKKAIEEYDKLYAQYISDFYAERAKKVAADPTATESYKQATQKKALSVETPEAKAKRLYDTNYKTVRSELENQYNNLVKLDPNAAYRGTTGDLPTIFNQQAAQLADAGVTSITNLRIQDGKLIDSATGKTVSTSNLGGQVAVDRDTGVQKWGDIFTGVKGGANYGIQALDDGSVVLFPAWEKSKSLTSQIVGSDLFKVASLALAAYGVYNLGTTLAGAGGAEAVSAAAAGGASVAPQSFQALLAEKGIQTAATTAGSTAVPGSFAAALPGLVAPVGILDLPSYGLLDETTFPQDGISTTIPPGGADMGVAQGITVVPPATVGAPATIAGLEAPGLSAMGGAQGVTVPVTTPVTMPNGQVVMQPGVVSEMGFVPSTATPALGDPSSFINDPNLLYDPNTPGAVISEDYLATNFSTPSGISIKDALDAARLGKQLLTPQQQMQQGGLLSVGGGQAQPMGVDFSPLYGQTVVGLLPLAEQYRRSLL